MARGRMIDNCISTSEKINDLTLKEAFIYTWIIPHLDDWGRITGSPRKLKALVFPLKKEISVSLLEKTLTKFKEIGLFLWEEIDNIPVLQQPFEEFKEHQSISEGKRSKSKYPEILETSQEMPRIPKKCQKNPAQVNLREEKIREEKISKDNVEYKLSEYLYKKIKENNLEHKEPNFENWAEHIDLMIRIDKRDPEKIKQVIEWCQKDDFWYKNILSTRKLREKYDQLVLNMGKAGPGGEFPKEVIARAKLCYSRNPGCTSSGKPDDPETCRYCAKYLTKKN